MEQLELVSKQFCTQVAKRTLPVWQWQARQVVSRLEAAPADAFLLAIMARALAP